MRLRLLAALGLLAGVSWAADPACPPRCVCVPETKKVTKAVYDAKCVEYCAPRWALGDWLCGRRPAPGECGTLRTKNQLIKYDRTCEQPGMKCVPAKP